MATGKTIQEIEKAKSDKIMETVAWRAGYYRANPHRFAEEVLGVHLKLFQKILIYAMFHYNYFMFVAARGLGKTWLTALCCVIYCILYPGTKIVVTSGTLKQANEVLLKIQDDFMKKSPILRTEIEQCNIGQNDATISFKNTSWIKTRTSTDNARSARANLIIVDEFRMVDKTVLDTVIRKFLSDPRHPNYLNKKEYRHLQERNKEIYMSSAWYKNSWSYEKAQAYTVNFFRDNQKYFICGLPYQLSIMEGLLMRQQVEDEMSEADFNEITWQIEMETMWYGDDEGSFFKLDDLNKARRLDSVLFPLQFYNNDYQIPDVPENGKRVMSVDIALMASNKKKKNDASAIYINDCERVSVVRYKSKFKYGETFEGLTTDELGIIVMRYFYRYKCTDLVVDTNGAGLGVYDYIVQEHYDPETGETYPAMTCINDDDMAERCKDPSALKVVWSIKANAKFNSQICIALRDGIRNGRIDLPKNELMVNDFLTKEYKQYKKLSPTEQLKIKMAYLQTTMAIYELIKLRTLIKDGNVSVKELGGMRKDRYSSIAYNYWCVGQLEQKLRPRNISTESLVKQLTIRKGRVHRDRKLPLQHK
jgi:hypothetical protein